MKQTQYAAAGGVAIHEGQVLVIRKEWPPEIRLPKGHVEEGESLPDAALREVREETGFSGFGIAADLGTTRIEFDHPSRDEHISRDMTFFLLATDGTPPVREPQDAQDDGRFTPLWLTPVEAVANMTFDEEREFVRRALAAANIPL